MKKVALYSKSSRSRRSDGSAAASAPQSACHTPDRAAGSSERPAEAAAPGATLLPARKPYFARSRVFAKRHDRLLLVLLAMLLSVMAVAAFEAGRPAARQYTQKDIDAAVKHTLEKHVLPSPESRAMKIIHPSVVQVRQLGKGEDPEGETVKGVGTGVVVVDKGVILTNLHVVAGADRVELTFANGEKSEASVVSLQPENDLAVLQAQNVPDDLVPATLRSTGDLRMGDQVIAVGFPFGIGPSVSSGVVSGLKRQYFSPEGEKVLSNLIQFDAAANPGNSGGPLVTMHGEVVGIVTAILNPNAHGVFIGIGFAVPIENAVAGLGVPPF